MPPRRVALSLCAPRIAGAGLCALTVIAIGCSDVSKRSGATEFRDSLGVVYAVNSPDAGGPGQESWRVGSELVIGETSGDPAYEFGVITGLAISNNGEIVVLDQAAGELRVFDASGAFLRRVSRRGSGPGELSGARSEVLIDKGDTLYVPDLLNDRINRFLVSGETLAALPFPRRAPGAQIFGWSAGGEPLIYREWNIPAQTSALLHAGRTQPDGPDTLIVLDYPQPPKRPEPSLQDVASGSATMQIDPFMPLPIWTVLESRRLVTGHTYAYQLRVYDADGVLERVIVGPRRREPVTAATQPLIDAKFAEQMLNTPGAGAGMTAMFELVMPDSLPGYTAVLEGPGETILAQRFAGVEEIDPSAIGEILDGGVLGGREWDVFDADGRYLGTLDVGKRLRVARVRGDYLYGVFLDELGVQRVGRFEMVRPS